MSFNRLFIGAVVGLVAVGCAEPVEPVMVISPDASYRDSAVATTPPCLNDNDCGAGRMCENGVCRLTDPGCAVDGDCPNGQVCRAGICESGGASECTTTADCPDGQACYSGVCEPIEAECVVSADCGVGEDCVDGQCVLAPECAEDAECLAGEQCVDGECVPPPPECRAPGDCAAGETCDNGRCVPEVECRDDADCPVGRFCRAGECFALDPDCVVDGDCAAGQRCERGLCTGDEECTNDAECDAGDVCVDNACQPAPPECRNDGECRPDEMCRDGRCVPRPGGCMADNDCPAGQACVAGQCTPQAAECLEDAQCGPNERCDDGVCVPRGAGGCVEDADCGPGEVCSAGLCAPGGQAGPAPGEILITEIMYDPHGDLADQDAEWIEVQNVSERDLVLDGCTLGDAAVLRGRGQALDLEGFLMPPTGILLFGRNPDPAVNGGLNLDAVFQFGLTNGGDTVFIQCRGIDIDVFEYDDATPARRMSLSRSAESLVPNWQGEVPVCMGEAVYYEPTPHMGTPGLANPNCQGDPPGCAGDADCPVGQRCVAGACVEDPGDCVNDGECPGAQVCENGACVPGPAGCVVDGDCGAGGVCEMGVCVGGPLECMGDQDCAANQVCQAGVCVAAPNPGNCMDDADCGPNENCVDGVCVPEQPPVEGDACEAPLPIGLGDRLMGTTQGAERNYEEADAMCSTGSASGPEVVYSFRAQGAGQICASTLGSGFDTILYVRRGECAGGQEVMCNDDVGTGPLQSQDTVDVVAGEQYFIFVDGFAGSAGAYVVALSDGACGEGPNCALDMDCEGGEICENGLCVAGCREDADCLLGFICVDDACVEGQMPPAEAGTCADPIPVMEGRTVGTTVGQDDAQQGSCASDGGDRVHVFDAPVDGPVCVDTVGSGYDTSLHVRTGDCNNVESEVQCNDDAVGLQSQVQFDATNGTRYFIVVDGYSGEGRYALNIALAACP